MTGLKAILTEAAEAGIIRPEQASALDSYLSGRGVTVRGASAPADAGALGLQGRDGAEDPAFETEAPRFIRGFHDILITIGVVVALVGVWGLGSVFLALPTILVLSEILLRRQRLALPAIALTVAFVVWIAITLQLVLEDPSSALDGPTTALLYALPFPPLLAAFHWRYRVPLSLALCLTSIAGVGLALVFVAIGRLTGDDAFLVNYPLVGLGILLAAAIALFATAMAFDLRDTQRNTRRSDVAFWLHLAAAPALLYTTLAFVFVGQIDGPGFIPEQTSVANAGLVVLIVGCFMAIGLIIDRRAFVTSGLLSFGFAVYRIFEQAGVKLDDFAFVTLIMVGVLVLTIGIGWSWFRRAVFALLPEPLKAKLPPLR